MSSIGVFFLPRRFYIGGSAASILFHITVVAIAVVWSTRVMQNQKGALPPVVSVQLGAYQLEKAPPQVVEGPKQVFSAPQPRQQKKEIQPEVRSKPTTPVAESAPATSAYSAGEATRSAANFTSAAQQAISGQVG